MSVGQCGCICGAVWLYLWGSVVVSVGQCGCVSGTVYEEYLTMISGMVSGLHLAFMSFTVPVISTMRCALVPG